MYGQGNFKIDGIKMGNFSLNMSQAEAEKIAEKKLTVPTEDNNWESETRVNNDGEAIYISMLEDFYEETKTPKYRVYVLKTKSAKFKTNENIGIGSTRDDLIDTYRNAAGFSLMPDFDEEGNHLPNASIFTVDDHKKSVQYTFFLKNNKVVEISISPIEPCC